MKNSIAYYVWFALAPFFLGIVIWLPIIAYFNLHWGSALVIIAHLGVWASVLEYMEENQ